MNIFLVESMQYVFVPSHQRTLLLHGGAEQRSSLFLEAVQKSLREGRDQLFTPRTEWHRSNRKFPTSQQKHKGHVDASGPVTGAPTVVSTHQLPRILDRIAQRAAPGDDNGTISVTA